MRSSPIAREGTPDCWSWGEVTSNKCDEASRVKETEVRERLAGLEKGELVDLGKTSELPGLEVRNDNTFGYMYQEVSALTGRNVSEAVTQLVSLIVTSRRISKSRSTREKDFGLTRIYDDDAEEHDSWKSNCCSS